MISSLWDAEALAVRLGSVIYTIWMRVMIQCPTKDFLAPRPRWAAS